MVGVLTLALLAGAQSRPPARAPAPMFSQAYAEALRGVLELEPRDVTALEKRLAGNPDDFAARLKLIAYSMRADRAGLEQSRRKRVELVLWLVEHRPGSEILGSPYGTLSPGDLNAAQAQRVKHLWESALQARPPEARVMWNAASFYRRSDRTMYVTCLEKAVALDPANGNYAVPLGLLYGGAILSVDPRSAYHDPSGADPALARRATERLETTTNPALLEAAVRLLQSEYNSSRMRGGENAALGALARRYFQRAKALDPGLDEVWVYPRLDPRMAGMFAPGARPPEPHRAPFEAAARAIRRLRPDAFPELPSAIRAVLRDRGCLVPQPDPVGAPRNVIRGEFYSPGQPGWAVLCSIGGDSAILVFRGGSDRRPAELAPMDDKIYLQDAGQGRIVYSREIQPVGRKFILTHYRAYGGPEPPPIDHQGIDDAFVGKASAIYYWFRGEWRRLQGAD